MKAMILSEYGENAEFQTTELPKPSVKDGHVLVRVAEQVLIPSIQ